MRNVEHHLPIVKLLLSIIERPLSADNYFVRRFRSPKRSKHTSVSVLHFIVGVIVAVILCVAAMNVKSYAESPTKYRVALAMYAFQTLRAMPIINNRSIAVGDVVSIETESVLRSAAVCYPGLREREIFSGHDTIEVSHDTALHVAGIAGINQYADFKADLQQVLSGRSVLLINNLKGYAPDPDQYELDRDKVSLQARCQLVHTVYDGNSATNILVSSVYRADISGGFYFSNSEMRGVNVSTDPWRWLLGHAGVNIRSEDGLSVVHVTGRSWGSIAAKARRINLDELAQFYVLFEENPETVASYKRLVHQYLTSEDPSVWEEIGWSFSNFFEKLGLSFTSIEDVKRRLTEKGTVPTAEQIEEVRQESWDAVGVVAAGAEIIRGNTESPQQ